MKLQGVSVIFALIVLPLILVLTYYIQLQVDTIEMQNEYDRKLLDSTYGAMSAFEINTANEDLSTVSDSLRTIIEASTNVFMNTLATNFGMSNASRSYLEPYIPAILYTLYDGYYISAPTRTPVFLVDSSGNAVTVGTPGLTIDKTSGDFTYREVHTSVESQNNCNDCIKTQQADGKILCEPNKNPGGENHIVYDDGDTNKENTEYKNMSAEEQAKLQITYKQLEDKGKEDSYGQVLFLKKNETNKYTTNIDEAELEIDHVLKTYMPYSARYRQGDPNSTNYYDITVIYTLDNYVTIQGNVGKVYYTKSGYLLPKNSVVVEELKVKQTKEDGTEEYVTKTGTEAKKLLEYNQNDAKELIESGAYVKIRIKDKINSDGSINSTDGTIISCGEDLKSTAEFNEELKILNNRYDKAASYLVQVKKLESESKISAEDKATIDAFLSDTNYDYSSFSNYENKLEFAKIQLTKDINEIQYKLDEISAVTYYVTGEIFSNWIYETFVNKYPVKEKNLVEISGQSYNLVKGKTQVSHDFENSETLVFNIEGTQNNRTSKNKSVMEIANDSPFYTHKLNIIRDSIQYNLNLAMSTYNNMLISTKDYAMPVIQNEEWEKILNNVSIVSFMQGYDCGLKTYSNYKIVSSTNNEISILPEEIYYVEKSQFSDETTEYHRINCSKLKEKDDKSGASEDYKYLAFISKDVKYDKIYNKTNAQVPYKYDHKNVACYECINDGNYKRTDVFDTQDNTNYTAFENLRKAYYIGVGKSRNNLYKMNAINNSEGYEIIFDKNGGNIVGTTTSLHLNDIKSIEIVLDTIKTHDSEENVLNYEVKVFKLGSISVKKLNDTVYTVVPNVATTTTLKVDVDPLISDDVTIAKWNLFFENLFEQSTAYADTSFDVLNYLIAILPDELLKSTIIVQDSIKLIRVIYK